MEVLQYDYYFGLHAKESHNKDTLLICLECIDGNQVHIAYCGSVPQKQATCWEPLI